MLYPIILHACIRASLLAYTIYVSLLPSTCINSSYMTYNTLYYINYLYLITFRCIAYFKSSVIKFSKYKPNPVK